MRFSAFPVSVFCADTFRASNVHAGCGVDTPFSSPFSFNSAYETLSHVVSINEHNPYKYIRAHYGISNYFI